MSVYHYIPRSVCGPGLSLVGRTTAGPRGAALVALNGGVLTWHLPNGAVEAQLLPTHQHLFGAPPAGPGSSAGQAEQVLRSGSCGSGELGCNGEALAEARCQQALALCRFDAALDAARQLGRPALMREVALAALHYFELPLALAAFEAAGDGAAAQQLRPLLDGDAEGDANLLAGSVIAMTGGGWRWVMGGGCWVVLLPRSKCTGWLEPLCSTLCLLISCCCCCHRRPRRGGGAAAGEPAPCRGGRDAAGAGALGARAGADAAPRPCGAGPAAAAAGRRAGSGGPGALRGLRLHLI